MTERPKPHTREEQAKLEIGHTETSLGVKWTLFLVGLLTLFVVPAVQTYREMRQHAEGRRESPWPQCCDIFDALPRAAVAFHEHSGDCISKVFRGNAVLLQAIDKYEKDLKAESFLTQFVLPPTQELLVYAGSGNEKGYVGRQRWLFYRPGIDYCTGPGFLNPRPMARRADSGTEWQPAPQPDPRAAIRQFHRQLAERGIRLVLMPTPDKATIHPERSSSRFEGRRMSVHNSSYRQFLDQLEAEGVLVCDVAEALAQYRDRSGKATFLATDTHWRPDAVELVAVEVARLIQDNVALAANPVDRSQRQPARDVKNLGDIAMMLRLRQKQSLFAEEVVAIRPVTDAAGMPWRFAQSDSHPVVNVSWNDAMEFCRWLGRKEGKTCRLPTEAEWEYACRAGTTTRYYHGDDAEGVAKVGNVADADFEAVFPELKGVIKASDGFAYTSPAATFLPNPFGLYDMHGNVWEWCADWYEPEYYAKSPASNPSGPATGEERVYRGGGWFNCARGFRSSSRSAGPPDNRHLTLGFRILFPTD